MRSSSASTTELRERLRAGEVLLGTFLNMGSSLAAEICGLAGFDWVLIDLEHGSGSESGLLHQLQALEHTGAAPVVRVESSERARVTHALDYGARGVMVPRLDSAEDAAQAVANLRYPPAGGRGVAFMNRAYGFGARAGILSEEQALCVVQIESAAAVASAHAIAALDGVDVLFVGPSDLSHALGILGRYDEAAYRDAVEAVVAAARDAGKATGVLAGSPEQLEPYLAQGFQLVAVGSDSSFLAGAARSAAAAVRAR